MVGGEGGGGGLHDDRRSAGVDIRLGLGLEVDGLERVVAACAAKHNARTLDIGAELVAPQNGKSAHLGRKFVHAAATGMMIEGHTG